MKIQSDTVITWALMTGGGALTGVAMYRFYWGLPCDHNREFLMSPCRRRSWTEVFIHQYAASTVLATVGVAALGFGTWAHFNRS